MHTTYSDGEKSPLEVLKIAEEQGLGVISITDHNSYGAHTELEKVDTKSIFSGTIIPGCEFLANFEGRTIEILAYGGNWKELDRWLKDYYLPKNVNERESKIFIRIKEKIKKERKVIISDDLSLPDEMPYSGYYKWFLFNEIKKHPENDAFFSRYDINDYADFNRKGIDNKDSDIYVDTYDEKIDAKNIVDLIHKNNRNSFIGTCLSISSTRSY